MKRPPVKHETNWKQKPVLDRIKHFEDGIAKCREYLETGRHADWHLFRPLFAKKVRGGKELPPHPDWVKNFVLPHLERRLARSEKLLARFMDRQ